MTEKMTSSKYKLTVFIAILASVRFISKSASTSMHSRNVSPLCSVFASTAPTALSGKWRKWRKPCPIHVSCAAKPSWLCELSPSTKSICSSSAKRARDMTTKKTNLKTRQSKRLPPHVSFRLLASNTLAKL